MAEIPDKVWDIEILKIKVLSSRLPTTSSRLELGKTIDLFRLFHIRACRQEPGF